MCALGTLGAFFLMCQDGHIPGGVLLGTLAILLTAFGLCECLGLLRATADDTKLTLLTRLPDEPLWQSPRVTVPLALIITLFSAIVLGPFHLAAPITVALLVLLVSGLRRPALFVFVVASLLTLPMLGEFALWDPWETHYGEVAREILARDDWITLWWAQDEFFRSKPIFIFWMEALSWGLFGISPKPDANPAHIEWAIRLPHYLLTMGALMSSYAAMQRFFGRRVAMLGALVLATTPYFYFLAHQAITDMPFVATMTIALSLLMLSVEDDPAREAKTYRLGPLSLSLQNVMIIAFVVVALPQILYLASRNLTFVWGEGFWLHTDQFLFGSAGNAGVPGNAAHRTRAPYLGALAFQPCVQALLWAAGLAILLWMLAREKRTRSLTMFGFYLFCSLAWMAKGIPGFALPGLIAGLYIFSAGRTELLLSGALRIGAGILTIVVTGLPWFVAMYARLGPFFTDRLLIHDHINRLAQGVHGDTGSIQYFLWQLGYGAFPWVAILPLAFVAWLYLAPSEQEKSTPARRTALLLALWGASAFVLFNAMITKFHHYIFPAVPPLALLSGLVLDRLLGEPGDGKRERLTIALSVFAPLALILGVAGAYGDPRGIIPESVGEAQKAVWIAQHGYSTAVCVLCVALGVGMLAFAQRVARSPHANTAASAGLNAGILASAALVAFAGRDLSFTTTERPLAHEHLIQLFIYNYTRQFPSHLDYRPMLTGFAVVLFGLLLLAGVPRVQKVATYALLGATFWLSAWALNVYMIDLTPHWSQRELIKRYYSERTGPNEPLIAWQMNWKGENIYTGNRVYTFVQLDNKAIHKWLDANKGKRAYFVLEHSRLNNFKRMMGKRTVEPLSTARENNKFILVRAQI
jgi:4-amino-4-deoxy-L-arabinose transferase-like glycosyltransferase